MADQELADIESGGPPLDNATIPGPEGDTPEPKRTLRDELSKNFKELREPAELRAKPEKASFLQRKLQKKQIRPL